MILPLSPIVTATFVPLPLPQALERLAAGTGERWICASTLKDEVLFARLVDAPVARVRSVVGEVLDARWEADGRTLRLVPDPAAARRRVARFETAREARLVAGLGRLRADLEKLPPRFTAVDGKTYFAQGEDWKKRVEAWSKGSPDASPPVDERLERATPGWRAAAGLTLSLPPRDILALHQGERLVYADRPTALQRGLPAAALTALAQYRSEAPPFLEGKSPSRVRLVVARRDGADARMQVEFQSLDAQGEVFDSDSIDLDPRPDPPESHGMGKPVRLDSAVVEHAALFSSDGDADWVRDERFARWSDRLQDPVRHEPLQWGVGAAVVAVATAKDETTIGTVTDAMTTPGPDITDGILPPNYLDLLTPLCRREDGWLVVDPPERLPRLDRVRAGDRIRQGVAAGGLTLDAAAAWVASLSSDDDWTASTLLVLVGPVAIPGEIADLRLWGELGPEARAALRAGRSVRASDLPAAAREGLLHRLYAPDPEPVPEPTERFAEGPPNAVLTLSVRPSLAVAAWNAAVGESVQRVPLPAGALGRMFGARDARGETKEPDRFRIGERRFSTLTVEFAPDVRQEIDFYEILLPPNGPVLNALPDDIAKAFEEGRARGRADAPRIKP